MVYNAITGQPVAEQRREGPVQTVIRAGPALRIRHGDEWRIDAGEQQCQRERLAVGTENAARPAAAQQQSGSVVDVGQHSIASNGSASCRDSIQPLGRARFEGTCR